MGLLVEGKNTQVLVFNFKMAQKNSPKLLKGFHNLLTSHSFSIKTICNIILTLTVSSKNDIDEEYKGAPAVAAFVCLCALQM